MHDVRVPGGERLTEAEAPPEEPRSARAPLSVSLGQSSRPSLPPPSLPRSSPRVQGGSLVPERAERPQLVVALVVGLALVAVPLYLWRRPRTPRPEGEAKAAEGSLSANVNAAFGVGGGSGAPSGGPASGNTPSSAPGVAGAVAAGSLPGGEGATVGPLTLGEIRVASCHDPGPRRTPPAECDRLPAVEQMLARAIQSSAACVPEGGGTIVFQLDASFGRKKHPLLLTAPREGRTVKSSRVVATCVAQVRRALTTASLESVAHGHSRYKVAVSATYPREPVALSAVPPPATGLSAASPVLARQPQVAEVPEASRAH